jgi:hypothetical protein
MKIKTIVLAVAGLLTTSSLFASEVTNSPSNQELLDILKKQQAQIEILQKQLGKTESKIVENDEKIEATVSVVEDAMKKQSTSSTKIGGYGELHYNNIEDNESIDFHRFVLFFGHEFSDSLRFFSEFELEHALSGEGKPGEVELEQAYIEMDLTASTTLKTGVFLVPVGITNETHEPPAFYGVERNPIEKNIIPSTWWEAGAGFNTLLSEGLNADFAVHSGLNVPTDGSKSFLIRSGRQKVAKASADSLAYTARVKYTAIPGLELAASYQIQTDVTQGQLDADANLLTAHAIYNTGSFGVRALYATWDIDSSEAELVGRDTQKGYFIEPSYRINEKFGLFARYNAWDNNAGDSADTEKKQTNIGLNYWPHEDVVFKLDFENRTGAQDGSGFNLGLGYQF